MESTRAALLLSAVALFGLVHCGKRGLESKPCVDYFAKTEACAAKTTNTVKADVLRQTAAVSKANFEKNANPMAVSKSCELMLEQLERDPDCK